MKTDSNGKHRGGSAPGIGIIERRQPGLRQGLRRLTGLVSLMVFPLTLNFFSPFVSQMGAWQGVVAGSVLLFASLAVSALFLGRSFCAWVCPAGACQDLLRPMRNRRMIRRRWIKYVFFAPWLALLVLGLWRNRPPVLDPLFVTENGVSVSEPGQYIVYYAVIAVFVGVTLAVGRRGACHTICWMAPFMTAGRKAGNLLRIPGLRLRAEPAKCTSCGNCTTVCPMSLSATKMAKVGHMEHGDCILCGECIDGCPEDVLRYGFGGKS